MSASTLPVAFFSSVAAVDPSTVTYWPTPKYLIPVSTTSVVSVVSVVSTVSSVVAVGVLWQPTNVIAQSKINNFFLSFFPPS